MCQRVELSKHRQHKAGKNHFAMPGRGFQAKGISTSQSVCVENVHLMVAAAHSFRWMNNLPLFGNGFQLAKTNGQSAIAAASRSRVNHGMGIAHFAGHDYLTPLCSCLDRKSV